ncbi:MAG TPA: RtcB family protein [Candidatus Binatia bacterium]|nr:RtcB family protein [Candidatus Binatia bacterium]
MTAARLADAQRWRDLARRNPGGWYDLATEDTGAVPVRLFLTPALLAEAEDEVYSQVVNATRFPGVRLVAITPDVHTGYGVPVGSVILTDAETGAVAMGPVGFDISCGMVSARSEVPAAAATPERRLSFNRAVLRRVAMGPGEASLTRLRRLGEREFEAICRGGAAHYSERYGSGFDRYRAERHRLPVDDGWQIPWGGPGRPERGIPQLGSLGGGNHFIELQESLDAGTLFVQVHTGSRGFGHGLATNYFALARAERPEIRDLDLGFFTPESPHYRGYLNAVAAAANFAIVNRMVIVEEVAAAFRETFGAPLELVYEISHNLVQRETHPELGEVQVHRKGATRAFPAGHPALLGTPWAGSGHPVLIPGSNFDLSFILRPLPGAAASGYSVNHGAGRRLSRSAAVRQLSQREIDDRYRRAGILVNADGRVPIDEAGPAYKSSQEVVDAVVAAGLAVVEHRLRPLASLKASDARGARRR